MFCNIKFKFALMFHNYIPVNMYSAQSLDNALESWENLVSNATQARCLPSQELSRNSLVPPIHRYNWSQILD